jgi:hypothetical protein
MTDVARANAALARVYLEGRTSNDVRTEPIADGKSGNQAGIVMDTVVSATTPGLTPT